MALLAVSKFDPHSIFPLAYTNAVKIAGVSGVTFPARIPARQPTTKQLYSPSGWGAVTAPVVGQLTEIHVIWRWSCLPVLELFVRSRTEWDRWGTRWRSETLLTSSVKYINTYNVKRSTSYSTSISSRLLDRRQPKGIRNTERFYLTEEQHHGHIRSRTAKI